MTLKDTITKREAAERLLETGVASPSEVAFVSGVSRQLMNYWAAGIKWKPARRRHLRKIWKRVFRP